MYSFVSVLVGGSVVGAIASFFPALANPETHIDPKSVLVSICIVLIASLPGWIVSIPIVVSVKNYSGWRFWAWCVTGICIGPTLILGIGVYGSLMNPRSATSLSDGKGLIVLATAVSVITTLTYLSFVSRGQIQFFGERD